MMALNGETIDDHGKERISKLVSNHETLSQLHSHMTTLVDENNQLKEQLSRSYNYSAEDKEIIGMQEGRRQSAIHCVEE